MKNNATFSEIAAALRLHQSFVIMSHLRPDGDALGCEIAMALCLKGLGKQVKVWNQDGMLDNYRYLPCSDLVTVPPAEPEEFDVVIALDTGVENRLGTCVQAVKQAKLWINIDHHVSNTRYGDLVHVDSTAPATGQILFELLQSEKLPVTPEIADNLFVAISTDTGSFQYQNTTARTYEIGAELLRAGVNVGKLSQRMYESHPRRRIILLRELLNSMRFSSNDQAASFSLSMATAASLGVKPEDNEGLIDTIRGIEGVVVAAFFEEVPEGKVRISLRSKDARVDVCKICAQFGGGGHTLAAGARTRGTLPEVEEKVLKAIDHEIGN
ncbi:MAG: bifunctional oligoribonuclease/PAP phosphatase NrnA [Verrucomicrobiota bacterium]